MSKTTRERCCPQCGSIFFTERQDKVYDTVECRQAASRARVVQREQLRRQQAPHRLQTAEADRVVVLLDVDGVLNAMSKKPPTHVWPASAWRQAKIRAADGVEYPFTWAAPVVEWLTGLHESGDVEIRWHTTWQREALRVGDVLGLPEFKVQQCLEWAEFEANGAALAARLHAACMPKWWKYPAAEDVVSGEGRRLIWIDDDIDYQITAGGRRALKSIYNLELVCPDHMTGLIGKHMRRVEARIADWKENPSGALSGS